MDSGAELESVLREDVGTRLRGKHGDDGYLYPAYEDYCFARIPCTIASLLGVDVGRGLPGDVLSGIDGPFDRVLVVLVDGYGFDHWRRDGERPPLVDRLTERGTVTPLTSIYPSETAAAITTFHTGALPAEHGVIGWNVYEPEIDGSFEALPFVTKDGGEPALDESDVAAADPIYPALREEGIESRHVVPFDETASGAIPHTYDTDDLDDFARVLSATLDATSPPSYVYAYLPHLDATAHYHGTESEEYTETLDEIDRRLAAALDRVDPDVAASTLVVVTADHGHVDTDPERNVDLSRIDGVVDGLRRHADGTPVRFAGSPRNVHLHLVDDAVEDVRATLRAELDARIFRRGEVLDRGLFGSTPSATFRRRVGDLVVTHRDLGAWWGDVEPDELDLVGMHGGSHPDEMLVPFGVAPLSELR